MKISEIEVGKVYFSSTSRDWQYAWWGVKKARVLKAEHAYWTWDRLAKDYKQASKGFRATRGIVVEVLDENSTVVETAVVPLASLKGLWDVVAPVVQSNRDERQKAENAATAARQAAGNLAMENYQKATAMGLAGVGFSSTANTVTPELMAKLLSCYLEAHREA